MGVTRALPLALVLACATPSLVFACNSDLLELRDWRAEKTDISAFPFRLMATVVYRGQKSFRMIHAGVILTDALGKNVDQVNLLSDSRGLPGAELTAEAQVDVDERIATLNPDDVRSRTCVWSIVFDDGTEAEF